MDFIKQWWLAWIFGGIAGVLSLAVRRLYKKVKIEFTEIKDMKDGILSLQHDRIYQLCNFHLQKGYITVDDLRNLTYLYERYTRLGGNGVCSELYNRCMKLRITTNDEKGE